MVSAAFANLCPISTANTFASAQIDVVSGCAITGSKILSSPPPLGETCGRNNSGRNGLFKDIYLMKKQTEPNRAFVVANAVPRNVWASCCGSGKAPHSQRRRRFGSQISEEIVALESFNCNVPSSWKVSVLRPSTTCAAIASPSVASTSNGAIIEKKVAIVWFKQDLRIDDHLGLAAASQYKQVLPLFIFDPYIYAGWSKELLESLFDAVADLRRSLRSIGSDLVVQRGRTDDILLASAREIGATDIITEEEDGYKWHNLVGSVSASLAVESLSGQITGFKQWNASLYDIKGMEEVPDSYKDFKRLRCPILPPLDPPTTLPAFPPDIDPGVFPAFHDFSDSIDSIQGDNPWWNLLKAAQDQSAENLLKPEQKHVNGQAKVVRSPESGGLKGLLAWREKYILESSYESTEKKNKREAMEVEETLGKYVVRGGASGAANIFDGYLRFLEPTGRNDWKAVYEHIWEMEKKPGGSFRALFSNPLALGTLSRRRILYEALKYERERNGGRLSPFGFSAFTVAAAVADVKSIEWFKMLQRKSCKQGSAKGFQVGSWRWRAFHIQYSMLGEEGPAVVLVHGFGAFWEHYRDNIRGLAERGNRVWALTMVGFGRSEKPNIMYTELLWAELVRDFIVEVVGEPVVLAGNSIGGYTTTAVTGLWPSLVKSVVLINTAGRVVPSYSSLTYKKPREKSAIAKGGAQLLLFYLQNLSNRMLEKCYPIKTSRVDDWLLSEVMRASYDPGSTAVLESIFHLQPPLPLNFFLDRYDGRVLVIQGMRDPLSDSAKRGAMLQAHCSNVTIQYLDAGHCPHDELPNEVNDLMHDWMRSLGGELPMITSDPISSEVQKDGDEDTGPADAADIIKAEIQLTASDLLPHFNKKN